METEFVWVIEAIRDGTSWLHKVCDSEEKAQQIVENQLNLEELRFIITKMRVW